MGKELARRRPSPAQKAVEERIRVIRGKQVVLDSDLAAFYGVETRRLTEQMKRNEERFPEDFVFQLSAEETEALRSQNAISKQGRGGRRYRPYAFTEQGALQASSVLKSVSPSPARSSRCARSCTRSRICRRPSPRFRTSSTNWNPATPI